MTEKEFQAQVVALATLLGWRCYHTYDSRRSAAGFPDLVLVHHKRGIIFAELKTDKAYPTAPQVEWLATLGLAAGTRTIVCLWKPNDWQDIERILKGADS